MPGCELQIPTKNHEKAVSVWWWLIALMHPLFSALACGSRFQRMPVYQAQALPRPDSGLVAIG